MDYRELFISPQRTLELIELQSSAPENLAFAKKYFGNLNSGLAIWNEVKPLVKFKSDPKGIDTIQGISTLFNANKNIHGVRGLGDCDCFTSALASIAIVNNIPYQYVIQGTDKPSHIAIKIAGKIVDLTNPTFNYLRDYNFTKYINPMYVALADGSDDAEELNDDFGRRSIKSRLQSASRVAQRFAPPIVTRQVNRAFAVANKGIGIGNRVANVGFNRLPPAAKTRILTAKRQLKKQGFSDSEADFLAIQNFSDDFGRRKISLKRGIQNVAKAGKVVGKVALRAAPLLLPVAGGALNLVAPGIGTKVSGLLSKVTAGRGGQALNMLKQANAARQQMQQSQLRTFAPQIVPQNIQVPMMPAAPMAITRQTEPEANNLENPTRQTMAMPETYVLPTVPITAPKNNNLLLFGGLGLGLFLLMRNK